ncbi:THO complex subunit 4A-like protein [Carex littledalei]|uniref:THO complex subunit 4A-like protein n=1 Tax=Carex littledalei TaxID=544730 RepID=A0A833VTJ8_9POAL|nr:THO complex subunit 4A-like protein [Carex littledalei]
MTSNLDMSLDDLIKKSKTPTPTTKPNISSSHRPLKDRRPLRRPSPYPTSIPSPSSKYGVYSEQHIAAAAAAAAAAAVSGRSGAIETGTKLYISNLDYGVSNEDVKELFAEVGEIKRYSINYDRSGRSKGTAEVVYAKKEDAMAAIRRYNNVQLDGKPMKIEFIGTNVEVPPLPPVLPTPPPLLQSPFPPFAMNWNPVLLNGMPKSGPGRGMSAGGPRGGAFSGRGRGRGRGNGKARGKPVSTADLDAELDKYHSEAMDDN